MLLVGFEPSTFGSAGQCTGTPPTVKICPVEGSDLVPVLLRRTRNAGLDQSDCENLGVSRNRAIEI